MTDPKCTMVEVGVSDVQCPRPEATVRNPAWRPEDQVLLEGAMEALGHAMEIAKIRRDQLVKARAAQDSARIEFNMAIRVEEAARRHMIELGNLKWESDSVRVAAAAAPQMTNGQCPSPEGAMTNGQCAMTKGEGT